MFKKILKACLDMLEYFFEICLKNLFALYDLIYPTEKTRSACPVTHWLDWSLLYEKWPTYQGKDLDNTLAYCHHKQVKWTSKCNATIRGLRLQRHFNIWGQMQKIISLQMSFGDENLQILCQCLILENHNEIWNIYPDICQ